MKELLKSNTVGYINPDVSICVHKYEQAKKSGKMDDQLKDYLDRWDKLGFLQGFPNDRKEELAFAYEQLAIFLIYCESDQTDRLFERNDNGYNAFETIGFPMTSRGRAVRRGRPAGPGRGCGSRYIPSSRGSRQARQDRDAPAWASRSRASPCL